MFIHIFAAISIILIPLLAQLEAALYSSLQMHYHYHQHTPAAGLSSITITTIAFDFAN
jgi:hypothetical protein